jgi:hypothetical protein
MIIVSCIDDQNHEYEVIRATQIILVGPSFENGAITDFLFNLVPLKVDELRVD